MEKEKKDENSEAADSLETLESKDTAVTATPDDPEKTEPENKKPKEKLTTQKDEIPNMDERAAQARAAGNTQRQQQVTETIVRERPKIGRNERVTIKHVMSGESKTVKYKQAIPLLDKGEWVLTED